MKLKYYYLFLLGKLRRHFFMQHPESERDWALTRLCFIINGATATAIGSLAAGAFIATLLIHLGVSDAMNGIIAAIPTAAGLSQIFMLQITKHIRKAKFITIVSCFVARIIYVLLVVIPFMPLPVALKTWIFVVLYAVSNLLAQFVGPCSGEWFTSIIPVEGRGKFISIRDSVTIVTSSVFSLVGSGILDAFAANIETGFRIIGIMILILTIIDSIALNIAKEPKPGRYITDNGHEAVGSITKKHSGASKTQSLTETLKDVFSNGDFRKIIYIYLFWYGGERLVTLFINVYLVSDLHMKYTFMSVISMIAALLRAVIIPITGKIADRMSYVRTLNIGVVITALSFIACAFCMPGPYAEIMYIVYTILYQIGISVFGVGIAVLLYSVPPKNDSAKYFAVNSTVNGIMGLAVALVGGLILDVLQKANVHIFGVHIYAQQIMSIISTVILGIMFVFVKNKCSDVEDKIRKRN